MARAALARMCIGNLRLTFRTRYAHPPAKSSNNRIDRTHYRRKSTRHSTPPTRSRRSLCFATALERTLRRPRHLETAPRATSPFGSGTTTRRRARASTHARRTTPPTTTPRIRRASLITRTADVRSPSSSPSPRPSRRPALSAPPRTRTTTT
jgi:hypothetical protein